MLSSNRSFRKQARVATSLSLAVIASGCTFQVNNPEIGSRNRPEIQGTATATVTGQATVTGPASQLGRSNQIVVVSRRNLEARARRVRQHPSLAPETLPRRPSPAPPRPR